MADYGFRCDADDGFAQVDGEYANFVLVAAGNKSTTAYHHDTACVDYTWYHATVTFPALVNAPLLAVNSGSRMAITGYVQDVNGYYTGISVCSEGGTFDYAVYAPADSVADTDAWGMHAYNGQGDKVFSSAYKYLLVRDVVVLSKGFRGNFTHAAVTKPYYVLGGAVGQKANTGMPLSLKAVNSTTGNVDWLNITVLITLGCLFPYEHENAQHTIMVCEFKG